MRESHYKRFETSQTSSQCIDLTKNEDCENDCSSHKLDIQIEAVNNLKKVADSNEEVHENLLSKLWVLVYIFVIIY